MSTHSRTATSLLMLRVSARRLSWLSVWPMLAACFALYYLRDLDTRLNL